MNLLNSVCRLCSCELTKENVVIRKDSSIGFRRECKPCRNLSKPKKTLKECVYCDNFYKSTTSSLYCSIKCNLLSNCNKTDSCWIFTGIRSSRYGAIKIKGKLKKAHRVSYEIFHGDIPEGNIICHSCDNPICVNPDHLWLGTVQSNMIDMVNKERHPNKKLSKEDVLQIRSMYKNDNKFKWIADLFGVSDTHITKIIQRLKWKHI